MIRFCFHFNCRSLIWFDFMWLKSRENQFVFPKFFFLLFSLLPKIHRLIQLIEKSLNGIFMRDYLNHQPFSVIIYANALALPSLKIAFFLFKIRDNIINSNNNNNKFQQQQKIHSFKILLAWTNWSFGRVNSDQSIHGRDSVIST